MLPVGGLGRFRMLTGFNVAKKGIRLLLKEFRCPKQIIFAQSTLFRCLHSLIRISDFILKVIVNSCVTLDDNVDAICILAQFLSFILVCVHFIDYFAHYIF